MSELNQEKPVVNMVNWQLYVHVDGYTLSGTADRHPHIGRDAWVGRTSSMQGYTFENDVLRFETQNTVYVCPLKFMKRTPYRNVMPDYIEKLTHRADESDSALDQIIAASAKLSLEAKKYRDGNGQEDPFLLHVKELQEAGRKELKEREKAINAQLIEIACRYEDCVYLEVSNVGGGNRLAYHLGNATGVVMPEVHGGMFQDSVLYMKYETEEDPVALDFRYFPKGVGDVIATYSWSDNIKRAVIKNDSEQKLEFNHKTILPGETVVFTPDSHSEGLFSPDCYNGKSIFFMEEES